MVRDHSTLGGKSFRVVRFFFEIGKGNQQREVRVLVPSGLEASVELLLNQFPYAIAPRLDHHASTGFRILCKIRAADDLLVPFGKIFLACGSDG